MSKYITLALAAILTLSAFSPSEPTVQDDPKSRAIVDKLIAKSKAYSSFTATFTNRLQSKADGLDVKQKGYIMAKGKKFKLTMDEYTIFCDGETVWTYSEESNEVTISDPSELAEEDLDPSNLLSAYEKGFKSKYIESSTVGETAVDIIKLFPIDAAAKPYHTVILTIDKKKIEPKEIKLLYKDGNEVTYSLEKFKSNTPIDDGVFTFPINRYPGVEVNDMR